MITTRCLMLLFPCRGSCYSLLSIRIVVVLAVLALAVVLALQGYPPGSIAGPVLVSGTGAAADRLVGVPGVQGTQLAAAVPLP
jgi:hypothetical protein